MKTTTTQLRIIEALVRTGSFSKAADELGITQPSVSAQLRSFEGRYQIRLIERTGHDIKLSTFGETLMPKIRALLALADEIDRALVERKEMISGELRIGYSTHQFAMPIISRFLVRHPLISLEARSLASYDLLDLLRAGAIDVAFVTLPGPVNGFDCYDIREEPIVLMVPSSHPLANKRSISWDELEALPLIRRESSSGTRRIFDHAARRVGVTLNTTFDLGSWESLKLAVLENMGMAIAMLGELDDDPAVSAVQIAHGRLVAHHYAVTTPGMAMTSTVAELLHLSKEVVGEQQ